MVPGFTEFLCKFDEVTHCKAGAQSLVHKDIRGSSKAKRLRVG